MNFTLETLDKLRNQVSYVEKRLLHKDLMQNDEFKRLRNIVT